MIKNEFFIGKRLSLCTLFVCICTLAVAQTVWHNPMEQPQPVIEGKAWQEENGNNYHRLPLRAAQTLRKPLYEQSLQSAGLYLRFTSNAPEITVRYTVGNDTKSLFNLVTIAHSGIDLYATDLHGEEHWCSCFGNAGASGRTFTYRYKNLQYQDSIIGQQYKLFLPLYNTVEELEIGVPTGSKFSFMQPSRELPVVIYGTSIAQGASASRPAMAWTNIVQRRLDIPIVNLGFSGNGRLEDGFFQLLAELKTSLYVIDCIPNMEQLCDSIVQRTMKGVRMLRQKGNTPVLLVENAGNMNLHTNPTNHNIYTACNRELRKAFDLLRAEGVKNLYYLSQEEIAMPADGQIDGIHPNDLGMMAYAEAYTKKISEILTLPIEQMMQQQRDGTYNWWERHQAVIKRNREVQPNLLLIGNSITHYWGGEPKERIVRGSKAWEQLAKKYKVTNMGFGWDRIENIRYRLSHGELDGFQAQHIFLLAGTNNLEKNTDEEIVEGVISLCKLIQSKQPQAQLYVVAILPRRKMEQRINHINTLLQHALSSLKGVTTVNLTAHFTSTDGSGKIDESLFTDGLHPNAKGYERMAEAYRRAITKK